MGKEFEKEWIHMCECVCVYVCVYHCCTLESITTVLINYTPI